MDELSRIFTDSFWDRHWDMDGNHFLRYILCLDIFLPCSVVSGILAHFLVSSHHCPQSSRPICDVREKVLAKMHHIKLGYWVNLSLSQSNVDIDKFDV